ncbi:MAG TPA: DnaA N-terminal domain-containing protein, partial [Patescibacteria group bacterium]|nr:DnaA N-terminal domain-containing protein [Patescibacteria group bacterium]
MGDEQKIWQAALGELELALSRANFTTWFKNTFISSYENGAIIIGVPNTFTKAWLEKKYHHSILKALQKITENQVKNIIYRVEAKIRGEETINEPTFKINLNVVEETNAPSPLKEFGLNPRYNFNNFVVGKGNDLAQAASLAVAQKPGETY